MADVTTAQKAPLIVDGDPLTAWDSIASSDTAVVAIAPSGTPAVAHAVGVGAGSAIVTVGKNGRSGSVAVTVTEAPLVVTLGTPVPK